MINNVEVYSKPDCPYCNKAKHLLKTMSIPFSESTLNKDFTREFIVDKFPHAKTYPIIVVDVFYIGGFSQLQERINEEYKDTAQLLNEGE